MTFTGIGFAYVQPKTHSPAHRLLTMTHRQLLLFIGLALSALFLWLALRNVDQAQLVLSMERLNLWWALPFVGCLAGFCWLKAARWSILLEPVAQATPRQLFPAVVIGYAGTTLMPLQLGEAVRAYVAAQGLRARLAAVLATIALERVLDVLVLVAVLGIALAVGASVEAPLRNAGMLLAAIGVVLLLVLALFAAHPRICIEKILWACRALPEKLVERIGQQLEAASQGLEILRRPSRFAALLLTSGLQWIFMLGCCWIALQALDLQIPHIAALLVLVTTLLGMSLPAGPGYVGTIQLAFWMALSVFGVSREDSAAASLFYHALLCLPLLAGGLVFVLRLQTSVAQLRRAAVADDFSA